jgi:hypothetical protein
MVVLHSNLPKLEFNLYSSCLYQHFILVACKSRSQILYTAHNCIMNFLSSS